jgi:isoquinoline 1-oxidoreductase beta subunit
MQGKAALDIKWQESPSANDSSDKFWQENEAMLQARGQVVLDDGDIEGAMAGASRVVEHQYRIPFVAHAPMEPQNCYAYVQEDSCHVRPRCRAARRERPPG